MLVNVVGEDVVYPEDGWGFVLREDGVVLHYFRQFLVSHLL